MKLKKTRNIILLASTLLASIFLSTGAAADSIPSVSAVGAPQVFATVGNTIITQQEYDDAYTAIAHKRYYHFKPPAADIATLQREVGDTLVTNALLLDEAKRRGLKPDDTAIAEQLRKRDQSQKVSTQTPSQVTRQLQDENLVANLKKLVRQPPQPDDKQLQDYYNSHLNKFTVPPQLRVSLILLRVDPSSPQTVWQQALTKGQELVQRLRAGANFADMAREISDHPSSEQGGDLGYLHGGMLDQTAQQTVDKLGPGDISDPIGLMEGVTIFRLTERQPERQHSFESAKDRIMEVWLSEQSEIVWNTFVAQLKNKMPVHVDESRYLPLLPVAENSDANLAAPAK